MALAALVVASATQAQSPSPLIRPGRADQSAPGSPDGSARTPLRGGVDRERNPKAPMHPFVLTEVTVEGSSLAAERLAAAYRPFVGQTMDNAALARITEAIAAVYKDSDIALYTVLAPEQRFDGGRLRLLAVEGYVEGVAIRGHVSHKAEQRVIRYLDRVRAEKPLRTSTLQRYVSLIRDIPGLYPELGFERGGRQGAVRLVVSGKARSLQLAVGFNNRGTALLGRTQGELDVFANGVLLGGDQLKATLVTPTEPKLFQFYGLAYSAPVGNDGTSVSANLGYLRTRPKAIPLAGSATSFGVQVTHPFIRSFDRNLYGSLSFDGVNSDNALFGQTLSSDRSRAVRAALSYATQGPKNSTTVSGTLSAGVNGFGARTLSPGSTDLSFEKLNLKVLDNVLVSRNLVLRLDGYVQATGDRLPASEQIALGGDEFGRAYEGAIVSGDYGVAGSAELAYRPGKGVPRRLSGSEVYVFTDAGRVWSRGRNGLGGSESHLASIGAGVRAQVSSRAVAQIEAVRGLYNPVFYENREVWRLLFSVRTLF